MWWFTKKKYPDFWMDYLKEFKGNPQSFVLIDCETTGLDYKNDEILSVGVVRVINNSIALNSCREWYLARNFQNFENIKIHGIMPSASAADEEEFVKSFLEYIKQDTLVGHHVAFDIQILNQLLLKNGLSKLKNKVLDTEKIFKKLNHWPQEQHISLDELLEKLAIKPLARHTALGDAFVTAMVFLKLRGG